MQGLTGGTKRARYYSLYPWILWDIEQNGEGGTVTDFLAAFSRRETAIAIATRLGNEESSVIGEQVVERIVASRKPESEIDTQIRVLPSRRLGGYEQTFRGSLYALGLTRGDESGVDHAADGLGSDLAKAAATALARTPYVTEGMTGTARVPWRVIEQSAKRLSLDGIRAPWAAAERRLILDVLFDRQSSTGLAVPSLRSSLVHLLHVLAAYERARLPVASDQVDRQVLYAPAYFGVLVSPDLTKSRRYPGLAALADTDAHWREFCLHQYLTLAVEWILAAALDLLTSQSIGLVVTDLAGRLTNRAFAQQLKAQAPLAGRTPASLLRSLGLEGVPTDEVCGRIRRERSVDDLDSEERLLDVETEGPEATVAWACHLLGVLYAQWRTATSDRVHSEVRANAGSDLAVATVLPLLDLWWTADGWAEAVGSLVAFLAAQHDRVMYEKRRLESCWLGHDGERLIAEQAYEPYPRTPRQVQALSILEDLLLVEQRDDRIRLTQEGHEVLRAELARG